MQLRYMLCNIGYVGRDCSLVADAVPVISSIFRGCTCDVRQFTCGLAFVTATNIYNSGNLDCRMELADSVVDSSPERPATVVCYLKLKP